MVFGKSYQVFLSAFVPFVDRSCLTIRYKWFPGFIGDQLEEVYDCHIAEFSAYETAFTIISTRGLHGVLLQEVKNQWRRGRINCGELAR